MRLANSGTPLKLSQVERRSVSLLRGQQGSDDSFLMPATYSQLSAQRLPDPQLPNHPRAPAPLAGHLCSVVLGVIPGGPALRLFPNPPSCFLSPSVPVLSIFPIQIATVVPVVGLKHTVCRRTGQQTIYDDALEF